MIDDLSGRINSLVASLQELVDQTSTRSSYKSNMFGDEFTQTELRNEARREIGRRESRKLNLPDRYFGEPGWNILLDLFANGDSITPVYTICACIASGAPSTTAIRWLELLENDGLVERIKDQRDSRRTEIRLTPEGEKAVKSILVSNLRSR